MALTTKRMNWLKYLYPGQDELQNDQSFHMNRTDKHSSLAHNYGILDGLRVLDSAIPDKLVHVQVGHIVDVNGKLITIPSIVDLDLTSYSSAGSLAYIVAVWDETATDPYNVPELATIQFAYYEDTPIIRAQSAPPSGSEIELARVQFTVGGNASTAADERDPQNNEIDHTHRLEVSILPASGEFGQVPTFDSAITEPLDLLSAQYPAGWKVMDPSRGTFVEQLAALSLSPGDRVWMRAGNYPMGGTATISVNNVTIAGSRSAVIQSSAASHYINVTGTGVTIQGIQVTWSASLSVSNLVTLNDADSRLVDVAIDWIGGAASTQYAVDLSPGQMHGCSINNGALGSYYSEGVYSSGDGSVVDECTIKANQMGIQIASAGTNTRITKTIIVVTTSSAGSRGIYADAINPCIENVKILYTGSSSSMSGVYLTSNATRARVQNLWYSCTSGISGPSSVYCLGAYSVISGLVTKYVSGTQNGGFVYLAGDGVELSNSIVNVYIATQGIVGINANRVRVSNCYLEIEQVSSSGKQPVVYAFSGALEAAITGNTFKQTTGIGPMVQGASGANRWVVKGNTGIVPTVAAARRKNTAYLSNNVVAPNYYDYTTHGIKVISGMEFKCTTPGTSSATAGSVPRGLGGSPNVDDPDPLWPLNIGGTVVDGTVTWTAQAMPNSVCTNEGDDWEIQYPSSPIIDTFTTTGGTVELATAAQVPVNTLVHVVAYSKNLSGTCSIIADYDPTPVSARGQGGNTYAGSAVVSGCTGLIGKQEYFVWRYTGGATTGHYGCVISVPNAS